MRNIKARCEQFETQIDYQRAYMSTQDSSHSILKKNTNFIQIQLIQWYMILIPVLTEYVLWILTGIRHYDTKMNKNGPFFSYA